MNLSQLHDLAAQRSYYSRADNEVYQAISSAAKKIYLWTAREYRTYFLKTDTTTIQLQPNVQQYACPPDLAILIRIGEQPLNSPPNTPFSWMRPADITSDRFILKEFQSLVINQYTPASEFVFSGPFLDQADAIKQQGANPQGPKQLLFAPIPFDFRVVKAMYAAQFIEIVNANSVMMMPMESHEAILDYAVAELLRPNGSALAATYEEAGKDKFQNDFLPFYRQQQITQYPLTQETYLDDLD
jgi:hypothetical protein